MAAGNIPRAFGCSRGFVPHTHAVASDAIVNRFEREVGSQPERQSARQQKAVPGMEQHRLRHAFHRQPALARKHRVALDSLMLRKVNGHVAQHREAAGNINLRLHQGKNLGERVHMLTRFPNCLRGRHLRLQSFGLLRQDD